MRDSLSSNHLLNGFTERFASSLADSAIKLVDLSHVALNLG